MVSVVEKVLGFQVSDKPATVSTRETLYCSGVESMLNFPMLHFSDAIVYPLRKMWEERKSCVAGGFTNDGELMKLLFNRSPKEVKFCTFANEYRRARHAFSTTVDEIVGKYVETPSHGFVRSGECLFATLFPISPIATHEGTIAVVNETNVTTQTMQDVMSTAFSNTYVPSLDQDIKLHDDMVATYKIIMAIVRLFGSAMSQELFERCFNSIENLKNVVGNLNKSNAEFEAVKITAP